MTKVPVAHPLKAKQFKVHHKNCYNINSKFFKSIFIRGTFAAGLNRYCNGWDTIFKLTYALNEGIEGGK